MLAKTHLYIAEEALKLSKHKFIHHQHHIKSGCLDEDHARLSSEHDHFQIIGADHFYHPVKKTGYFSFSKNAKQRGLEYFNKSVVLYKKGKFSDAFRLLGKSLHLLADIAVPSHTRLEAHLVDIFEHHIEHYIPKFHFKLKSQITPQLDADYCFERLAKLSYRVRYKKHFFRDTLNLLGLYVDKDNHKKLHRVSNRILKETIIHSAILISLFHSRVSGRRRIVRRNIIKIRDVAAGIKHNVKKVSHRIKRKAASLKNKIR